MKKLDINKLKNIIIEEKLSPSSEVFNEYGFYDKDGYFSFNNEMMPILVLANETSNFILSKGNDRYKSVIEEKFDEHKMLKRDWFKIFHQTAGHACHHHNLIATIIKPKLNVYNDMCEIDNKYFNSDIGLCFVSLEEVNKYNKLLKDMFNVSCNLTYESFEEGFYPIDYTPENIKKLTSERFPIELDNFIDWGGDTHPWNKFSGSIGRWKIFILGKNCD